MNINEVAKKAKVSRSTVSRVINNHPTVKENTRIAVQRVIDELNYIPNAAARSLASNKTNIIGVLVYNIIQPFWGGIFAGIEQGVSQTDYGLFLANSKSHLDIWDYKNDYKKNLKNLVLHGVDGIIIALANDLEVEDVEFLKMSDIPFVIIQNSLHDDRIACVNVDNITAAYDATRYLIDRGHRHIIHATGPIDSEISKDRMRGFVMSMQEAGLPIDNSSIVNCGFLFNDGYWCMKRLMGQECPPTAILFANDVTAFGAYHAAQEEHVSIPNDISIVGFDQLINEMDVASLLPDLTTMSQPVSEIGIAAAQMLFQQLEGNPPLSPVTFSLTLHEGVTSRRLDI
ncbi:MAG: LacI family DNA-binding transcriptional regulator [Acetanaerobacterium sp.]